MRKFAVICCTLALVCCAQASWYWPFGSDEDEAEPPRISELMEQATDLIEEASDLAMDGKSDEAIEKYRQALKELDRVEWENPDRAQTSEFATLRNKRAYVNATIDSMLLNQVKENGRVVAVSNTTELEKKLAEERWTDHMKQAREAFARKDVKVAMGEMRKALGCYTNVFLRAVACNVKARADLLSGDFDGACRSLAKSETCLRGYETTDSFVEKAIRNSWSDLWRPLHDYGEVVATAEVIRVGRNIDLTCISSLSFLKTRLQQYDFKRAEALRVAVTNLMACINGAERDSRTKDENLAAGMGAFNAAASDFGNLGPEVAKVRDALARVEIPVKRETNGQAEPMVAHEGEKSKPLTSLNSPPAGPVTRREQAILDIANGDYAAAELFIKGVLESKPDSAMALNLRAAMEMKQGKLDEAERTLDHAVSTNPREPSAYYNMAVLSLLKDEGNKSIARRYYETYRTMGGSADSQLEALLK